VGGDGRRTHAASVAADVKVRDLTPGSHGHNLVLQVVSVGAAVEKTRFDGSASRLAEAVLADESGCVTFTARNGEQSASLSSSPLLARWANDSGAAG
jgi:ssDNA-binding replication factor A large subunit